MIKQADLPALVIKAPADHETGTASPGASRVPRP
jgi:hypothetical protein